MFLCVSAPLCLCVFKRLAFSSVLAVLLLKPGEQSVAVFFVVSIGALQNVNKGVAVQPGILLGVEQRLFRSCLRQFEEPLKASVPYLIDARPGLFAVRTIRALLYFS